MKVAVVSDIHGNKAGLDAIVADARAKGVSEFWCLGDLVGYGPYPVECLEWARDSCRYNVKGNHEGLVLLKLEAISDNRKVDLVNFGISSHAVRGIEWTVRQLYGSDETVQRDRREADEKTRVLMHGRKVRRFGAVKRSVRQDLIDYMQQLDDEQKIRSLRVRLLHDNPLHPGGWSYVIDQFNPLCSGESGTTVLDIFEEWDKRWRDTDYIFVGHLHIPFVCKSKKRYVCNPGSCMYRRGKKALSYAIFDPDRKHFPISLQTIDFDFGALADEMKRHGLSAKFMEYE